MKHFQFLDIDIFILHLFTFLLCELFSHKFSNQTARSMTMAIGIAKVKDFIRISMVNIKILSSAFIIVLSMKLPFVLFSTS